MWTDDEEPSSLDSQSSQARNKKSDTEARGGSRQDREDEQVNLDWKDYIALTIASLQTFLLPLVIFIVLLVAIVLALAVLH